MTSSQSKRRSDCPISYGLDIFGDKWTLLILRDLLLKGKSKFGEFLGSEEGIASNILTDRLVRLEQIGLITKTGDKSDRRQSLYRATKKGTDLLPALVELAYWGANHDAKTAAPKEFVKAYRIDRSGLLKKLKNEIKA
jgi:DNA-binding HxlR family transcriptional regulator